MEDRPPLTGYYSSGQFVDVRGEEECNELKLLGCFGQNLESAKRKDDDRRGPLDRLVLERVEKPVGQTTASVALTLHEAYYLAYALGCLQILTDAGEAIDLDTCWTSFRNYHKHSNIHLDFAIEYGVYHYFKTRGWIVKTGENYGTNFLLYRLGPSIDHAQYAIKIVHEAENNSPERNTMFDWRALQASQRVNQSVCKELLVVHVITDDLKEETHYLRPDCLSGMEMMVEKLTCKTNLMI